VKGSKFVKFVVNELEEAYIRRRKRERKLKGAQVEEGNSEEGERRRRHSHRLSNYLFFSELAF